MPELRNTSFSDCDTSPQEAERRGAHEAGVEDEICGGGGRPLCSRCLLSGILPHLPQQVGGDAGHIEATFQVPIEGGVLPEYEKSPF